MVLIQTEIGGVLLWTNKRCVYFSSEMRDLRDAEVPLFFGLEDDEPELSGSIETV